MEDSSRTIVSIEIAVLRNIQLMWKGSNSGNGQGSGGGFFETQFDLTLYWVGWTRSISLEVQSSGIVDGLYWSNLYSIRDVLILVFRTEHLLVDVQRVKGQTPIADGSKLKSRSSLINCLWRGCLWSLYRLESCATLRRNYDDWTSQRGHWWEEDGNTLGIGYRYWEGRR